MYNSRLNLKVNSQTKVIAFVDDLIVLRGACKTNRKLRESGFKENLEMGH